MGGNEETPSGAPEEPLYFFARITIKPNWRIGTNWVPHPSRASCGMGGIAMHSTSLPHEASLYFLARTTIKPNNRIGTSTIAA